MDYLQVALTASHLWKLYYGRMRVTWWQALRAVAVVGSQSWGLGFGRITAGYVSERFISRKAGKYL